MSDKPAKPDSKSDNSNAAGALPSFVYTFTGKDAGGRWRGRAVRIFKRAGRPFWYVQLVQASDGKQHRTVLKTESRTTATQLAIEVCDRVWSGLPPRPEAERKETAPSARELATIGAIIAQYRELGRIYQRPRTVEDNINSLRLVVREGLGDREMGPDDVDKLRSHVLTGSLVRRFEEGRIKRIDGNDRDARRSTLVSVNSYMRSARSVFQPEFVKRYTEDRGLVLPVLTEFMEQRLEQPARQEKPEPPQELIRKTCEEAKKLKESNPPAYVAFLLGLCSLRRGEVMRCEAAWFQERGGEWLCVIPSRSKSDCRRRVPMPPQVVTDVLEYWQGSIASRPEADRQFILPTRVFGDGHQPRHRAQNIIKAVNKWMRELGWTTRHTLHELRAYYLHEVREQFGEEAAQATAGHAETHLPNTFFGPV